MFSSWDTLKQKTGRNKPGRSEYLKLLTEEFKTTTSTEMKYQVLANLANFAYDPINYGFLREFSVINLFMDLLNDEDETIVRMAAAGLCNLALDPENKEYILSSEGVGAVSRCLSSSDETTVESSITTLMYLVTVESKPAITSPDVIQCMLTFADNPNTRLSNLAKVFLEDYCTPEQIESAKNIVEYIPLHTS